MDDYRTEGIVVLPFWPTQSGYQVSGLVKITSSACGPQPDGREIIRQSILRRGVPSDSLHIVIASFY